jgi:hypothetical protein
MSVLPPAIAAYFGSAPAADINALRAFFSTDAHVHDAAREYDGLEAIRAWRLGTHARTPFTARPLDVYDRDGALLRSHEANCMRHDEFSLTARTSP